MNREQRAIFARYMAMAFRLKLSPYNPRLVGDRETTLKREDPNP